MVNEVFYGSFSNRLYPELPEPSLNKPKKSMRRLLWYQHLAGNFAKIMSSNKANANHRNTGANNMPTKQTLARNNII